MDKSNLQWLLDGANAEIDRLRAELAAKAAQIEGMRQAWIDERSQNDALQEELERPLKHMTCDTHLQLAHERAEKAEAKLARVRDYVETLPYYIDEDNTAWNLLRLLDTE